jgi:hypothetical protein
VPAVGGQAPAAGVEEEVDVDAPEAVVVDPAVDVVVVDAAWLPVSSLQAPSATSVAATRVATAVLVGVRRAMDGS